MAGRLLGAWNPALDSAANPISGAKLYTYTAGTTTPKATYTDSGLGTPNTNPVVADSAGRFVELWSADGGTYDLKWTDAAGTQIKLFQSIQALGSAATGAVARDFGADGKFNLESRGGTTYLESGDADPDNIGGKLRLGGWAGTQGDMLVLDYASITGTSPWGSPVLGTVTNGAAAAGNVGELIKSVGATLGATSGTPQNITSISLTAGDWDVSGSIGITGGSGTTVSQLFGSVSSVSSTLQGNNLGSFSTSNALNLTASQTAQFATGTRPFSLAATTTLYLVGEVISSGGTATFTGSIMARRVR